MSRKFTLQCPMPELDFEVITLGHGSGGHLTNRLLDQGIFALFDNEELQARHDGALLDIKGKIAFTTDSFVITPVFFPSSNIGELAVNGTVNDLAMCGAEPRYLSLSLIIEEGMKLEDLWEILAAVKVTTEKAGVTIVTGDTKVVDKGKGDQVFINTTGIGRLIPGASIDINRISAGDAVIISGPMATHGMAIMTTREGIAFESDIISDTRPLHNMTSHLIRKFGERIKLFRDPTRGGVATVLNEIARQCALGIELVEKDFPVEPQVAAACEILGLDPLYVANEGIFLAVVDEAVADEAVEGLRQFEGGERAGKIGNLTKDHPRKVFVRSAIGGRRVVGMLSGEQLPRIC